MVNHDQERIETVRKREISDQINGKLLKRTGTGQGERREGRGGQVGVNLHLLTESTTCNKVMDERGHTRPPVVLCQEGIGSKESPMSRSERRVNRRDKVVTYIRRNIKTTFKIESGIRKIDRKSVV